MKKLSVPLLTATAMLVALSSASAQVQCEVTTSQETAHVRMLIDVPNPLYAVSKSQYLMVEREGYREALHFITLSSQQASGMAASSVISTLEVTKETFPEADLVTIVPLPEDYGWNYTAASCCPDGSDLCADPGTQQLLGRPVARQIVE